MTPLSSLSLQIVSVFSSRSLWNISVSFPVLHSKPESQALHLRPAQTFVPLPQGCQSCECHLFLLSPSSACCWKKRYVQVVWSLGYLADNPSKVHGAIAGSLRRKGWWRSLAIRLGPYRTLIRYFLKGDPLFFFFFSPPEEHLGLHPWLL